MLNIEYMINHYQIPSRGLTKNVIEKEGFITSPKGFIKKEIGGKLTKQKKMFLRKKENC